MFIRLTERNRDIWLHPESIYEMRESSTPNVGAVLICLDSEIREVAESPDTIIARIKEATDVSN